MSVIDNTGIKRAKIIQVFSGKRVYARIGCLVRVSTKSRKRLLRIKKVKSHRRHKIIFRKKRRMSIIVRTCGSIAYNDGMRVRFLDNGVIFFKKRKVLRGKRFYGLTSRALGYAKYLRKFKLYL